MFCGDKRMRASKRVAAANLKEHEEREARKTRSQRPSNEEAKTKRQTRSHKGEDDLYIPPEFERLYLLFENFMDSLHSLDQGGKT